MGLLLVGFGLVAAVPVPIEAQPVGGETEAEVREAARQRYLRGRQLLEEGNAIEALPELAGSYQLYPHWASLYGMAMCQEALGRPEAALELYERVLREADETLPESERAVIQAQIDELRRELGVRPPTPATGHLVVQSTPAGAAVRINGEPAGTTPLEMQVLVGRYVVEVELSGYESAMRLVDVPGGRAATVEFGLVPIDRPQPPREEERGLTPAWFWASVGLAGALGVAGTITGSMTLVEKANFDDAVWRCNRRDLDACREGHAINDRYEAYRLATNILLPSAGAVAAAAVTLFFFTDFDVEELPPATVGVGPTPGGVAVTAVFGF